MKFCTELIKVQEKKLKCLCF